MFSKEKGIGEGAEGKEELGEEHREAGEKGRSTGRGNK
jgi:hypothetical protein